MAGIQGSLLSCREEDDSPGLVRTVTDMRYISQMREGDRITDIYLCKQKQTLRSKSGKNYFSMILQDRTGIMDAKIWDLSNGINHFEAMDYIHVEGEVTSYQGSLQLNVRRVRLAQESEYDPGDYLPRSRYNPDAMYQELQKYMDSLQNEKMKKLVKSFLVDDKEMAKEYSSWNTTISQWEKKVTDMEDSYYRKFSAMETALSKMQSSASQLSSYLGG